MLWDRTKVRVSFRYYTKDGTFQEWGTASASGCRYEEFANKVMEARTWREAIEADAELAVKHSAFVNACMGEATTEMPLSAGCMTQDQHDVITNLMTQSDREILFVIDYAGGRGKSWLCKWLIKNEHAWACQGGKVNDLMHSYDVTAKIAVFDMARCNNTDWWPWNFLENLKNGWFCSTKYNGRMKMFEPPKILVLSNSDVPQGKLSEDRIKKIYF